MNGIWKVVAISASAFGQGLAHWANIALWCRPWYRQRIVSGPSPLLVSAAAMRGAAAWPDRSARL